MAQICVDASVALKLVLDEEGSDAAHALWAFWVAEELEIIAPCDTPHGLKVRRLLPTYAWNFYLRQPLAPCPGDYAGSVRSRTDGDTS